MIIKTPIAHQFIIAADLHPFDSPGVLPSQFLHNSYSNFPYTIGINKFAQFQIVIFPASTLRLNLQEDIFLSGIGDTLRPAEMVLPFRLHTHMGNDSIPRQLPIDSEYPTARRLKYTEVCLDRMLHILT